MTQRSSVLSSVFLTSNCRSMSPSRSDSFTDNVCLWRLGRTWVTLVLTTSDPVAYITAFSFPLDLSFRKVCIFPVLDFPFHYFLIILLFHSFLSYYMWTCEWPQILCEYMCMNISKQFNVWFSWGLSSWTLCFRNPSAQISVPNHYLCWAQAFSYNYLPAFLYHPNSSRTYSLIVM